MTCSKCSSDKIWRNNRWVCRDCQIKYQATHYQKNREIEKTKRIELRNKVKLEQRIKLNTIKSVPCADCKEIYPPCVMEFDHIAKNKKYAVSQMIGSNWDRILNEIKKCEIVCANCHRMRTHNRLLTRSGVKAA